MATSVGSIPRVAQRETEEEDWETQEREPAIDSGRRVEWLTFSSLSHKNGEIPA